MNILITGAGGYIGRNLAAHLIAEGHSITALVTQASGKLKAIAGVKIIEAPGYHDATWNAAGVFENHDLVIHTAGRVHYAAEKGAEVTQHYKHDNVELTLNLTNAAKSTGVKRFLFISSIGAQLLENRFHEGRMLNKTAWAKHPYRMSKLEAERGLVALHRAGGIATCSVRLPMVYGADAPGSFSTLTRLLRKHVPLPFGGFTHPRAFVSIETVKDFVSYYLQHANADGKIWAIRDRDEISPKAFAFTAAEAGQLGRPRLWTCPSWILESGAAFFGFQQSARSLAEPVNVDLEPITAKLGWQPRLTVAEGLKKAFSFSQT